MKRLTWITNLLAALMIVVMALGALCGAANQIALDENFYSGESRFAVAQYLDVVNDEHIVTKVTEYIGLSSAEQDAFAVQMVSFMKGETDAQPDVLNEKEQMHMLDVRRLVRLAQSVSKGCMTVAAGIAMVIAWISALNKRRGMPFGVVIGMLILAAAVAGVYVMLDAKGFEALFVRFHELFFTNDLWLMNPETDILIRMMPQLLFERAGRELARLALQSFLITDILLMLVHTLVGGMISRQLTEGKEAK